MGYMNLLSFTRLMKDKVLAYTYNYIDVLGCDTYVCLFSCFDLQYMYAYKGNVTLTFFYFT